MIQTGEQNQDIGPETESQEGRIKEILDQIKTSSSSSDVISRLRSKSKDQDSREVAIKTQINLLQRVAAFTQAYPELSLKDDSVAEWFVSEWAQQLLYQVDQPKRKLKG